MRLIPSVCALAMLAVVLAALPARADDCESARCALQSAINSECPCDSPQFTNHGRYVSCVARAVNRLAKQGAIPTRCKGKVKRCAARSLCGKPGRVACALPVLGTCDLTAGTCIANSAISCTTDAECAGTRCKILSSVETCTAAGGALSGASTCCSDCVAPATPAP